MTIYNKIVLSEKAPENKYVIWINPINKEYSINLYLLGEWTPINAIENQLDLIYTEIKDYIKELVDAGYGYGLWGLIQGNIELLKDLLEVLNNKVDKQKGKGLSSVDVTDDMVLGWNQKTLQAIDTANESKTVVELLRELIESLVLEKQIDTDNIKDGAVTYNKINSNSIATIEDIITF